MSSLTRRMQIRNFRQREDIEKVPCPFGGMIDTGMIDDKGQPILAPKMVWPRLGPKREAI
jgi:hypothetical protein